MASSEGKGEMDPYRTIETACDICCSPVAADELRELYTVKVCPACTSRQNDELLERQGYTVTITDRWIHHDAYHYVEVSQDVDLSIIVNFNREELGGKLLGIFGKGDHKVGHKDFDSQVKLEVDEEYTPIVDMVLERQAVRDVIMALLEPGRENLVQLVNSITSARWVSEHEIPPEQLPAFDLSVLVLARLMRSIDQELRSTSSR